MDKYEYNLKLDQMKSRYAEEKYDEAADIADTINWNKVKNAGASFVVVRLGNQNGYGGELKIDPYFTKSTAL